MINKKIMIRIFDMNKSYMSSIFLIIVTSVIISIVSLWGILNPDIYNSRLNEITKYALLGQDVVTLIISMICILIVVVQKESNFRKVLISGLALYYIYIYAYYTLSIISSRIYIIHILIFSLSFFQFVYGIKDLYDKKKNFIINDRFSRKTFSIFFFFCVLIMLIIEVPYIFNKTIIENSHITTINVFYIFDLALVFPSMVLSGILNLRKNIFGHILIGLFLIKIISIMPAIIIGDLFNYLFTGKFIDLSFDIIAIIFTFVALVMLILYNRGIQETR
jgi:hypothetical protein